MEEVILAELACEWWWSYFFFFFFFCLTRMMVGPKVHRVAWWPQCGHGAALCADRWSSSTHLRHSVSRHARLVLLPHPKRRHTHPVPTAPHWRGPNTGGSWPQCCLQARPVGRLLGTAVFLQRLRQFMLGCREGPKKGKQTFDSSFREGTKNASFIRLFQHFNTDYWPDNRTALRPFLYAFNCEK